MLVSGSRDGQLRVWDVARGAMRSECRVAQNTVTALRWIPGSDSVAQSSEDKTLRVWDVRSGLRAAASFPRQQYIHVRLLVSRWFFFARC